MKSNQVEEVARDYEHRYFRRARLKEIATISLTLFVTCVTFSTVITTPASAAKRVSSTILQSYKPLHGAHVWNSCDIRQNSSSDVDATFGVTLGEYPPTPIEFVAPYTWECFIVDAGLGQLPFLSITPSNANPKRAELGIYVNIAPSVRDGISTDICPYSTYDWHLSPNKCDAESSRKPPGSTIRYLLGDATSGKMIVLVTSPRNVPPPPFALAPSHVPTVEVIAADAGSIDMWMSCSIEKDSNSMCLYDAQRFADTIAKYY
jgi:hypothetical protein